MKEQTKKDLSKFVDKYRNFSSSVGFNRVKATDSKRPSKVPGEMADTILRIRDREKKDQNEGGEMATEYRCYDRNDQPFVSERCKASVADGMRFRQCQRRPWKDGWCKAHHPETEAKRRRLREARWQRKHESSPAFLLQKAHKKIARLEARIVELEAEIGTSR